MNKFLIILTYIGVGFLFYFGGILVGEYNIRPFHSILRPAFHLADMFYDRPMDGVLLNSWLWSPRSADKTGLVSADPSRAFDGYTLLSSAHAEAALLYDMQGDLVHKWNLPFNKVWEEPSHGEQSDTTGKFFWRSMHLYPNGNLLVSCAKLNNPRGCGLAMMDRESKLIWTFDERTSGEFTVDTEGRIYTIVREIRNEPVPELPQIVCPFIDDVLVTLSPEREVLSRVSLMEQLVKTVGGPNLSFLRPLPSGTLDTSSAHPVSRALASKLPAVNEGDMLVSMSSAGLLAIVSSETGQISWITNGPWKRQTSALASVSGDIIIFDSQGLQQRGMKSSVVRFDPVQKKVTWLYAGQPGKNIDSASGASLEELPNGNILVTEAMGGRVFELTADRKVVWDWVSPYRAGKDDTYVSAVLGAKRYGKDDINFKFNKGGRGWF